MLTTARDMRFASTVDDFPDEDAEFSRLGSRPKDPNDFIDGGSALNDVLVMLVGLDGYEFEIISLLSSELLGEGWGVVSLSVPFSKLAEFLDDAEDWLPRFSISDGRDGDPTGVCTGEFVCERADIDAMALPI